MAQSLRPGISVLFPLWLLFLQSCQSSTTGQPTPYFQSSDATLKSLQTSVGDWSSPFDPAGLLYTVTVAHPVDTIQVTPTSNHKKASISVNGTAVKSATASEPINLEVGSNEIDIVVLAENGNANTYQLTVVRAKSDNALLASLAIEGAALDRPFDPLTITYQAVADSTAESVRVIAVAQAQEQGAKVILSVDGVGILDTDRVPLAGDTTLVLITVVAPDAIRKMAYHLTISRRTNDPGNAYLAVLAIDQVELSPPFDAANPQVTEYSGVVPAHLTAIHLHTETVSTSARVQVSLDSAPVGDAADIPFPVGEHILTIEVTSGDGLKKTEYHVSLSRTSASDVAELADIVVSMGPNNTLRPLYKTGFVPDQPGFDSQVFTYGVVVFGFYDIQIIAIAKDAAVSSLTIDGAGTPVDGQTSQAVQLVPGGVDPDRNVRDVKIVSVSPDGSRTLTYHLLVRLLNAVEFYYGIYAPVQRVSKEEWYARVNNSPDLGLDEEFTGAAHGTMHWTIKLSGLKGRNSMAFDHYNNGSQGFPYIDDGWYENGVLESLLSIQGNGTQTGTLELFTHELYNDRLGTLSYHLTIVNKESVAGADSYSECNYLGETHRFYYNPVAIHESLGDGWDPYEPWTPEDFQ